MKKRYVIVDVEQFKKACSIVILTVMCLYIFASCSVKSINNSNQALDDLYASYTDEIEK